MKNKHWFTRCLVAAAASLVLAAPAGAASDMFLKIDGIKGESTDKQHPGEIDVLAWSWGMARAFDAARGGMSTGRPCVSEMTFTKYLDVATPPLMANVMSGMTIPNAKFTLRKGGEAPLDYFVVELTGVLISSVQDSGGGGDVSVESIGLRFTTAKVTYRPQKADGSAGPAVSTIINLAKAGAGAC